MKKSNEYTEWLGNIRVSKWMKENFERTCVQLGKSISEVHRQIISEFIRSHRHPDLEGLRTEVDSLSQQINYKQDRLRKDQEKVAREEEELGQKQKLLQHLEHIATLDKAWEAAMAEPEVNQVKAFTDYFFIAKKKLSEEEYKHDAGIKLAIIKKTYPQQTIEYSEEVISFNRGHTDTAKVFKKKGEVIVKKVLEQIEQREEDEKQNNLLKQNQELMEKTADTILPLLEENQGNQKEVRRLIEESTMKYTEQGGHDNTEFKTYLVMKAKQKGILKETP